MEKPYQCVPVSWPWIIILPMEVKYSKCDGLKLYVGVDSWLVERRTMDPEWRM